MLQSGARIASRPKAAVSCILCSQSKNIRPSQPWCCPPGGSLARPRALGQAVGSWTRGRLYSQQSEATKDGGPEPSQTKHAASKREQRTSPTPQGSDRLLSDLDAVLQADHARHDRTWNRSRGNLAQPVGAEAAKAVLKAKAATGAKKAKAKTPKDVDDATRAVDSYYIPRQIIPSDERPRVPSLSYGLDRVLFNPGVYHLQDPRSRVFNFDPYLSTIMPIQEFNFDALRRYMTSSEDPVLNDMARRHGLKYAGSTSSMTSALSHFHFLLSAWRPVNPVHTSKAFTPESKGFTRLSKAPAFVFLRCKDGGSTYSIDASVETDTESMLSLLGRSMEKLLTLPKREYERYRLSSSAPVAPEASEGREAYHYTSIGDILMRSQLDAFDRRVPGTGMFDLKTRAVVSIRMNSRQVHRGVGYEIRGRIGQWESFEREYFDMIRSAFLKYSLQVRIGRMDGIFVAFHNTNRIFGFQYISINEMDLALHGTEDGTIGHREFKLSVYLMNMLLDKATQRFPGRSLKVAFETRPTKVPIMYMVARPVTDEEMASTKEASEAEIEKFRDSLTGLAAQVSLDSEGEHELWAKVRLEAAKAAGTDATTALRRAVSDALATAGMLRFDPPEARAALVDRVMHAVTEPDSGFADDAARADHDHDDQAASKPRGQECPPPPASAAVVEEGTPAPEEPRSFSPEAVRTLVATLAKRVVADGREDAYVSSSSLGDGQGPESGPSLSLGHFRKVLLKADDTYGLSRLINAQPDAAHEDMAEPQDAHEAAAEDADEESVAEEGDEDAAAAAAGEEEEQGEAQGEEGGGASSDPDGEVYALGLTIRNKVNGSYAERPEALGKGQSWVVEYDVREFPAARAQRLWQQIQGRREKAYADARAEPDLSNDYYRHLAQLSKRGRSFRASETRRFAGDPVVVWERTGRRGVNNHGSGPPPRPARGRRRRVPAAAAGATRSRAPRSATRSIGSRSGV